MSRSRTALLGVGLAVALLGAWSAQGEARLTLLNTGIRIDYPPTRGLAGLVAAGGLALAAAAAPRRWLRLAMAGGALISTGAATERLVYRLEAGPRSLSASGLFGGISVPWREVSRVESGPELLVVWGRGDAQIRIGTADFRPEQRATLERTIARRVSENPPAEDEGLPAGGRPR